MVLIVRCLKRPLKSITHSPLSLSLWLLLSIIIIIIIIVVIFIIIIAIIIINIIISIIVFVMKNKAWYYSCFLTLPDCFTDTPQK